MDPSFNDTVKQFDEFRALFNQPKPALDKCKQLMDKLRVAVTKFSYTINDIKDPEQQKRQLLLSREILEHAAILSAQVSDIAAFERYFAQLKTYYYDYASRLPPSQQQHSILGLNLLRLLAKNKLDEFHTELELIPLENHANQFIQHPIKLEQYMMEGAYNKVLKARADVPSSTYSVFMDMFMETVRDEIADCLEKAYHNLSVTEAQKLLGFSSPSELEAYSKQKGWQVGNVNGTSSFVFKTESKQAKTEVPTFKVMQQTLHYARELERIV